MCKRHVPSVSVNLVWLCRPVNALFSKSLNTLTVQCGIWTVLFLTQFCETVQCGMWTIHLNTGESLIAWVWCGICQWFWLKWGRKASYSYRGLLCNSHQPTESLGAATANQKVTNNVPRENPEELPPCLADKVKQQQIKRLVYSGGKKRRKLQNK